MVFNPISLLEKEKKMDISCTKTVTEKYVGIFKSRGHELIGLHIHCFCRNRKIEIQSPTPGLGLRTRLLAECLRSMDAAFVGDNW